ncbi:MAG: hypothetical protein CVT93_03750 [Bacteroidetes bacterium HGW-Bacteroidetes-10]|nr:MAG: hypothetical protein CVT93_03750 [Bacteroidetes bacterium HGW-Bacteroidetes-10]
MAGESKGKQETFISELLFILAVTIAGFALQFVTGALDFSIFASPVNIMLAALLLALAFVKPATTVGRFGSGKVSVILLVSITLMSLYMGLVPGNDVKHSWPFAFTYLMIMANLALTMGRRLRNFKLKRDYSFMLNHFGLFILLVAAGPGSADMQRYFMRVSEGQTEWRGEREGSQTPEELPLAIALKDFSMEEYSPRIALIDKATGETQPSGKPSLLESIEGSEGVISEWAVVVDTFDYRPRMAPRAFITATRKADNTVTSGWVSCGNHFQPFSVLDVSERLCFAMTFPEPKKFTSDVVVYTKSGIEKKGLVEVNKPLTAGSWKVYQYSYDTRAGRDSEISVFELVYDPWIKLVYTGIILVMLGSLTLFWKGGKKE